MNVHSTQPIISATLPTPSTTTKTSTHDDEKLNAVFCNYKDEIGTMEKTMNDVLHKMNSVKKRAQENEAVKNHLMMRNMKMKQVDDEYDKCMKVLEKNFEQAIKLLEQNYTKSKDECKNRYDQSLTNLQKEYNQQKRLIENKWSEVLVQFSDETRQRIMDYEKIIESQKIQEAKSALIDQKYTTATTTSSSGLLLATSQNTQSTTNMTNPHSRNNNSSNNTNNNNNNNSSNTQDDHNDDGEDASALPLSDFICKSQDIISEIKRFASESLHGEINVNNLSHMSMDEIVVLLLQHQKPLPPSILRLLETTKLPPVTQSFTNLVQISRYLYSVTNDTMNLPIPGSVPLHPIDDD